MIKAVPDGRFFRDFEHLLRSMENNCAIIESVTKDIVDVWHKKDAEIFIGYSRKDHKSVMLSKSEFTDYLQNVAMPHFLSKENYEQCAIIKEICDFIDEGILS